MLHKEGGIEEGIEQVGGVVVGAGQQGRSREEAGHWHEGVMSYHQVEVPE